MSERREHTRHNALLPVSINTMERKERLGLTRDVSAGGMLFQSMSRFAPGEEIEVRIALSRTLESRAVGHVIRTMPAQDPDTLFKHLHAVRFREQVPELDLRS